MTPIVLAALSALIWGTADYSGGRAAQRAEALAVTVTSQMLCLPLLALCVILLPGTPAVADLAWGASAGLAGFVGIVLLYRALASGAMAVVAPVAAVTAAILPIGVGLFTDSSPGPLALGGVALAVVAIGLVSLTPQAGRTAVSPRLIAMSLVAGVFFGLFFALLGQSSEEAGMWPLAAGRLTSVVVGVALLLGTRTPARLPRSVLGWTAVAGTLEIVANAFYLAAAVRGHLSVVAAIAALYPASTVLLALAIDRERLRPVQIAGLGLAATALVLATT